MAVAQVLCDRALQLYDRAIQYPGALTNLLHRQNGPCIRSREVAVVFWGSTRPALEHANLNCLHFLQVCLCVMLLDVYLSNRILSFVRVIYGIGHHMGYIGPSCNIQDLHSQHHTMTECL